MGIAERRKRESKAMRRRILEAAMELFTTGGLAAVTMRAIAGAIEYSPATIYLYFRNKEAIVHELRLMGFERLLEGQEGLVATTPAGKRLWLACQGYVHFAAANPRLYELMFVSNEGWPCEDEADCAMAKDPDSPPIRSLLMFQDMVNACLTDADREAASATPVLAVWSAMHGLAMSLISQRLPMVPEEQQQQAINQIIDFTLRDMQP
jgi:AcrR family transcriptional regulator